MSSDHPTTSGLEYFFEFLKDHRINQQTGGFTDGAPSADALDFWKQSMDITVGIDNYLHVVMGDDEWARMKWLMSDAPLVGPLIRLSDNINYWTDYFKNTGLSWSDVLYPSRLAGSGAGGYSTLNFVSSNIEKLYR